MKNLQALLLTVLLLSFSSSLALAKPHEMKTHSSKSPGSKVTVVHFGAPW